MVGIARGGNMGAWRRVSSERLLWLAIAAAVALAAAGCGHVAPGTTPTPSGMLQQMVGEWIVQSGYQAKTDTAVTSGEKVQFGADGRYTWGARSGRFSVPVLGGTMPVLVLKADWGEEYDYNLIVAGDVLTMTHSTDCGKADRYVLHRAP